MATSSDIFIAMKSTSDILADFLVLKSTEITTKGEIKMQANNTKLQTQRKENEKILQVLEEIRNEKWHSSYTQRLRSCQAWVQETDNFYLLKSYDTYVAAVKKSDNSCYDFLRKVYGYTATSAQHIAKFFADYSDRYATKYRYYYVEEEK